MNINFKDKKTIGLMIAAGILVLLTIAIVAIFFLFPTKKIEIPEFTNKNKTDVDTWIMENEIPTEQVLMNYEFNETIGKDVVLSQSIIAGENLKKDDVLTIILSNGPDPDLLVTLPDFTGMKHDEIDAWFVENKFTDVTYEYIPDAKIKKDIFIKSNVTETDVKRSTPILISISVGTESVGIEIAMPDFKDYTKANIQAWGKTNNITISFKEEASETIASGKVISQDPKAGTTIKTGGKITVTLSTGKGSTATNFAGKTKKDVDSWAKTNNIKISYVEVYDNKVASGTVISNKPNSGTMKSGATMTVNISVGKPSVDNYTGKSKDSFNTYIDGLNKKSANLKITVTEVESDKAVGTIIEQIINNKVVSGATTVDTGTTITIKVAKVQTKNVESKPGSSYDDFKKYVEGLGMKVGAKSEQYNDTYNSGIVVSNDSGSKPIGTSINFIFSLGKYTPNAAEFDGRSKTDAQNKMNEYINKKSGSSISFNEPSFSDKTKDLTYGCQPSGKNVICNISKGPEPKPVDLVSFADSPESALIGFISSNKLNVGTRTEQYSDTIVSGNIISNDIGSFLPGHKINYVVSKGPEPTFTIVDLQVKKGTNGQATYDNVNSYLLGLGIPASQIKFEIVDDSGRSTGEIYEYTGAGLYKYNQIFTGKIAR